MNPVQPKIKPFVAGEMMSWEEFEERWNAHPEIKFAELIAGKVYMPLPVGPTHGSHEVKLAFLLQLYANNTPGCDAISNTTCRVDDDALQPDVSLRILESYGGRSVAKQSYVVGVPEFVMEVCVSSAAYDLHEKKEVYRKAGVVEFVAVLPRDSKIRWHQLEGDAYTLIRPKDGIFKSVVFPGLWMDSEAILNCDMARASEILNAGLASEEHKTFVAKLSKKHKELK